MTDLRNPYAPPVETSEDYLRQAPPPEGGGLSLSDEGWEVVAGMSKWMRIVAGLQYAGGALVLIAALFIGCQLGSTVSVSRLGGRAGTILAFSVVMMLAYAVLLFLGATWLRGAAGGFYEGVVSDHESPLAEGFRKLRLYLILYGIFSVIGLLGQLVKLALVH